MAVKAGLMLNQAVCRAGWSWSTRATKPFPSPQVASGEV